METKVVRKVGRPKKIISEVKPIEQIKLPFVKVISDKYIQISRRKNNTYPNSGGNIIISPTANCQVFSIASFNNTLNFIKTKEELLHVLKTASINGGGGKKLCLVDLQYFERNKLRRLLKEEIILDSPYISTNKSKMTLFLIKVWPDNTDYTYTIEMNKIQANYK
jgi:hypothetical protein